ncbi:MULTISPECIES: ATP-dependent endonuclease [unclassified Adlercreutzia]|uniref:ATP-dependent nuclease n=1 Tax=unclassified Adlercreutzia TaxID=2636013 RepID=UPI0013EC63A8|nr:MULTISPECIES: TOPRIM nucleotidyl transferase/hydrolase domain-containing protein [unclassified Adlercreutzia]
MRIRLSAKWSRSANAEGSIDGEVVFIMAAEGELETKENCVAAKRQLLDSIRMIYVPASRNPKAELRLTSGTIVGGLIRSVKWGEAKKSAIRDKIGEISDTVLEEPGANAINKSLHDAWGGLDSDSRYGNARLTFGGGSFESVVSHPAVTFSPTPEEREYEVEELGDGLKSLFYFSMVKGLVELEGKLRQNADGIKEHFDVTLPALTLLAVEEPENHIAPHLLGKLMLELRKTGEESHCQVIVTSHSPAIAGRVEPTEVRHFRMRRESNSTICRRLALPDNAEAEACKYVRGSLLAYPEVLFAKAVVLGEGSSEEIVLPRAIGALCGQADANGISVAPLGGRHVNHFWRLFNELDIPYVTLLDLDRERFGGGWGRIKYAVNKLEEFKKDEVFDWPGGISTDSPEFESLGKRGDDDPELDEWIDCLESKGVFFSAPLDLDFAMLCAFPRAYKAVDGANDPRNVKNKPARSTATIPTETRQHAIECVLHSGKRGSGGDGSTYTEEQKDLMPYYKSLFLGKRGKPGTHILALADVDDESFGKQMPKALKHLAKMVSNLVSGSPAGVDDEA